MYTGLDEEFKSSERLVDLMKARGWSYYELAKRLDCDRGIVSRWISQEREITVPSIKRICKVFGITLEDFFRVSCFEEGDTRRAMIEQMRKEFEQFLAGRIQI